MEKASEPSRSTQIPQRNPLKERNQGIGAKSKILYIRLSLKSFRNCSQQNVADEKNKFLKSFLKRWKTEKPQNNVECIIRKCYKNTKLFKGF